MLSELKSWKWKKGFSIKGSVLPRVLPCVFLVAVPDREGILTQGQFALLQLRARFERSLNSLLESTTCKKHALCFVYMQSSQP